jgi:hypothetical protein
VTPRLAFTLSVLLSPCACRIGGGVDPVPFTGPAPRSILVWPSVASDSMVHEDWLLAGVDHALARRGYDVTASVVARQVLADRELTPDADRQIGELSIDLAADAALFLIVYQFDAEGDPLHSARWDLAWELRSLRGGGVIWRFAHSGAWNRSMVVEENPLRPLDADPDLVPQKRQVAPNFRDAFELMSWLHHHAMEHMPAANA